MFDSLFAEASDEAVVAWIEQSAREEARICARRSAAIAELVHRYVDEDDERGGWVFDPWAATAAQVGAALNIGQRKASGQMHIAVALRYRLPKVAQLFTDGVVGARVVSEISWRTQLVEDPAALAQIDDRMAACAVGWGRLSEQKLKSAIDAVIERFDPDGVRRSREILRLRDIHVGASDDPSETAALWGQLLASDGRLLKARLAEMVGALCAEDPRPAGERRSDAMGAIIRGEFHLNCRCASPNCPVPVRPTRSNVVIKVIADQAAIEAAHALIAHDTATAAQNTAAAKAEKAAAAEEAASTADSAADGGPESPTGPEDCAAPEDPAPEDSAAPEGPAAEEPAAEAAGDAEREPEPQTAEDAVTEVSEPQTSEGGAAGDSGGVVDRGAALGLDGRPVPIALLAEMIRGGAKTSELTLPGPEPEPRYRPSAALAEFVRMRDLFCRFPGCDIPAERCDIDHTVPYPFGPTHASNLSCKCRGHHLLKTFWYGPGGWRDEQHPDGSLIWTAPTGHTYITKPGSRLYFPSAAITTADLPPPPTPPPGYAAGTLKMPRRRRNRAADTAARDKAERAHNAEQRAQQQQRARENQRAREQRAREKKLGQVQPPPETGADPPPF
ncbi:HNH endonuclease signature motif containing protein [Mycolicibacterium duvalii]|uniref:HNH endonuclease signature motif containing protein n=2 Tax=Mycolicibacterium duvalii TaxID=39688 RepID=UPI001FD25196|nr:HNH endonuclease signature motif containing protein [Mycolicibacterium duvalii]